MDEHDIQSIVDRLRKRPYAAPIDKVDILPLLDWIEQSIEVLTELAEFGSKCLDCKQREKHSDDCRLAGLLEL